MDRHGGRAMTRLGGGVLSGIDAWSREARWVRERATRLGLALDEEQLAPRTLMTCRRCTRPSTVCGVGSRGRAGWCCGGCGHSAAAPARRA